MTDPIDRLLAEHETLLAQFEKLQSVVEALERRGDDALGEAQPALLAVCRMMTTDLRAHARREDEALFPALEAVFGSSGTPTEVMREEHRAIHSQADLFHRTLHELNEIEHPRIMAGASTLRDMAEPGASAEVLRATGQMILDLVHAHFAKEEDILFPMAREVLSAETLAEVADRMEGLDRELAT